MFNLKTIPLNPERKRILLIGAAALILGAAYRFYPDVAALFSVSDAMAVKRKQVETTAAIVARLPQVEKESALWKGVMRNLEDRLMAGATPSLAAVEIQNRLNTISGQNGVTLESMRVMNPVTDEGSGFVRLPVQFYLIAGIDAFKEMIYQIESDPKLLIVRELSADLSRSDGKGLIRATLTVEGVMRASASEEKSSRKKKAGGG